MRLRFALASGILFSAGSMLVAQAFSYQLWAERPWRDGRGPLAHREPPGMGPRLFILMVVAGTIGAAFGMRISRIMRRRRKEERKPPSRRKR